MRPDKISAARASGTQREPDGAFVIVLPWVHPSLNVWVNKRTPWVRNREKQLWAERIETILFASNLIHRRVAPRVVVTVTSFFPDSRRRDFDNYVPKFILDGLRGRVLDDDSSSEVIELRLRHGLDRKAWRTEIIIEKEVAS